MALYTIQSNSIKAVISTLGAEIQSVTDQEGRSRIWNGDPAFWTGRAPILFPVAGAFRDLEYEYDGVTYPMPKHGIARKKEWRLVTAERERAVFAFSEKAEGFPFEYELTAAFVCRDNSLEVTYTVENRDSRAFWFSIGAHEAYMTPEGVENYEVVLEKAEDWNASVPGKVQGYSHDVYCLAENTDTLALSPRMFDNDALVFMSLESRRITLRRKDGDRSVTVAFPGHDFLLLWQKPDAPYLCIEPWCNGPDFEDADKNIASKRGFMRLEKGKRVSKQHTITFD